ncbi:MAG: protein kinase, partial [Nannocystaceae bacterium]
MVDSRLDSSQAATLPYGEDDSGSHREGPTEPHAARDIDQEPRLQPGQSIGRFTVTGILGHGGMGVVYAARDPELSRELAVKVLHRSVDEADERARARLLREARAMAQVSHPNLVTIYDVGSSDGQVFIAMELIVGQTLGQWRLRGDHGWREIVQRYCEAGRGLQAAHEQGLVHRDFKPGNVLLSDRGRVQVVDFGLARAVTTDEVAPIDATASAPLATQHALALDLTRTGTMVGTPAYMAPEQFQGQPTDPRTDQFALCVALWEALFDQRPFEGTTMTALMFSVLEGRRRPAPANTEVPEPVIRALERGLRVDPSERFADMNALLQALQAATSAAPGTTPRSPARWLAGIGVVAVAVAATVAVWMLARPDTASTDGPAAALEVVEPKVGLATLAGYLERRDFRSTTTRWQAAQRDFEQACEARPDRTRWCAAARFCAGQVALEQREAPAAQPLMREAAALDPTWALPHVGLAAALRKQGELDAALEASISAQGLDPDSWVAVASAAATHVSAGRLDDAIDEYLRALQLAPDHPQLLADLALVYHARRLDSQAERYATAALAEDPDSMPALMLLAERALESGEATTALMHADRAVAVGSQSVTAW